MEGLIRWNCSKILTNQYSTVCVYIMIDVTWVVLVVCLVWTSRWELYPESLQKDCWWWWLTFWLPERSSSVRFNLATEALLINNQTDVHMSNLPTCLDSMAAVYSRPKLRSVCKPQTNTCFMSVIHTSGQRLKEENLSWSLLGSCTYNRHIIKDNEEVLGSFCQLPSDQ